MMVPEVSEKICTVTVSSKKSIYYSGLASSSCQGSSECRTSNDGANKLFDSDAFLDVRFPPSEPLYFI